MSPRLHQFARIGLPVLAVIAFALGCLGYAAHFQHASEVPGVSHIVYVTLRLFVFEYDGDHNPVWQLNVARFLAAGLTTVGAFAVGLSILRDSWHAFRLDRARDHVVVCGAGAKGELAALDCLQTGDTVVVVDQIADAPSISKLRQAGALFVHGDITDGEALRKAQVGRARMVMAVAGSDETNVTVAAHARLLAAATRRTEPLLCFTHVVDPELRGLIERERAFVLGACSIRLVDAYAAAARRFITDHPLETGMTGPDDPRQVHLVVLGLGKLGRALVVQAIRVGHYANLRKLRITVVDKDAELRCNQMRWVWPLLDEVCDLRAVHGGFDDPKVRQSLREEAKEPAVRTVAICLDDDARAVTQALRIRDLLTPMPPVQMAVRLGHTELAELVAGSTSETPGLGARVVVLDTHAQALRRADLLDSPLDMQARAVHEDYLRHQLAKGPDPTNKMLVPWSELTPAAQDANRQQADHIDVKLRAIGCRTTTVLPPSPVACSDEEVELLAKMEHARWAADKVLQGYRYGPVRDNVVRTHPDLLPWESLTELVREKDREPVRNIGALLRPVGLYVERAT